MPGGFFSSYLVHEVRPGDTIEVLPPSGTFTADLSVPGDHVFVVAGSGITPALSLAGTVLRDGESTVTVFYGNRRTNTVMFADELADLKDRFGTRLQLVHVLSREPRDAELTSGRLDGERLRTLVDEPRRRRARRPLVAVRAARDGRRRPGAARPSSACRPGGCTRSCSTSTTSRRSRCAATRRPSPGPSSQVTVVLDGRSTTLALPRDVPVLDSAQKVRGGPAVRLQGRGVRHLPGPGHRRRGARCAATTRWSPRRSTAGYVLTCQTLPVSDAVTVDFDA